MSVTVSKLSPSSNLQHVLFLSHQQSKPKDVHYMKQNIYIWILNWLLDGAAETEEAAKREKWMRCGPYRRGETEWRLGQTFSFLLCCLTLFCLVVHVSSSSFCLSFNRSSWMLSVEVQIRVEKLSELETAKKTPPDFIPPEASSVCLCRSIQRGSTDLRINQWCKCEGKGRSCSTIQSRIDDRLTSRLHTV